MQRRPRIESQIVPPMLRAAPLMLGVRRTEHSTNMELTEKTIIQIRSLSFDPNAKIMPGITTAIGSITWSDEIPNQDYINFLIEPNCDQIFRLFSIRMHYWDTGTMSQEHETYWREAQRQFPDWPLFQRLELNKEERRAHEKAQAKNKILENIIFSLADEIEVRTEGGITTRTAIIIRESLFKKVNRLERGKRRRWQSWR